MRRVLWALQELILEQKSQAEKGRFLGQQGHQETAKELMGGENILELSELESKRHHSSMWPPSRAK